MTPMAVGELGEASREHNEHFRLKFYSSFEVVEERASGGRYADAFYSDGG